MENYMTKIDVCRTLKISRPTLEKLIKAGTFSISKIGGLPFISTDQLKRVHVEGGRHNHKITVF
jgi:hypothetical protein